MKAIVTDRTSLRGIAGSGLAGPHRSHAGVAVVGPERRPRSTSSAWSFAPGAAGGFVERRANGSADGFEGRFREVTPPERIAFSFEWDGRPGLVAIESMTLEEIGEGRSRLVTVVLCHTTEERDGMLHSGMEGGFNQQYDGLERALGRPGR